VTVAADAAPATAPTRGTRARVASRSGPTWVVACVWVGVHRTHHRCTCIGL
jgi:hypothetical protein